MLDEVAEDLFELLRGCRLDLDPRVAGIDPPGANVHSRISKTLHLRSPVENLGWRSESMMWPRTSTSSPTKLVRRSSTIVARHSGSILSRGFPDSFGSSTLVILRRRARGDQIHSTLSSLERVSAEPSGRHASTITPIPGTRLLHRNDAAQVTAADPGRVPETQKSRRNASGAFDDLVRSRSGQPSECSFDVKGRRARSP